MKFCVKSKFELNCYQFGTCLRTCHLFAFFLMISISSFGQIQTFSASIPSTVDLTGAAGTCASPGTGSPDKFTIPVSGVGTLSATNALVRVSVTLDNSCTGGSANMNLVSFRVMAPGGNCVGVYSGGLSTVATGTHTLNLVSSVTCLNNPQTSNDPTGGANSGTTSNYGFFNAQFSGTPTDLTTSFNALNADGNWMIIFSETTSSEPCLVAASLTFGNPVVSDQTANGDNCSAPIVWTGGPICASTSGKTGSTQMPGSPVVGGTAFGTIGGITCDWNGANNNDVWIKFTPTSANVCISISGLDFNLQSIVVTDSNADGDNNPCTGNSCAAGSNDPNWTVMSCPRPNLYTTTSGTQLNQQHCFTAVVGQMYYLVVDGNGGAESPFYISGVSGLPAVEPPSSCPVGLASFTPTNVTIASQSSCNTPSCTVAGGVISAPASSGGCPAGSTLQYRITVSGVAGSWSTSTPVYDQDGPAQTIETRCSCNSDATMVSLVSTPVTTAPGTCVGNPACSCPSGLASFTPTNVTIASQSSCNTSNCTVRCHKCSLLQVADARGSTLLQDNRKWVAGSWSTRVMIRTVLPKP
ncbi:MAG: hypothetical protein IPP49_21155 [Saprospiraceae bacterium]|nr:hypothetical protein [Saprospiraceae bacterium]